MKNKTDCKGLCDNYKRMLEKLTEWKNVGGYIYETEYAVGEYENEDETWNIQKT